MSMADENIVVDRPKHYGGTECIEAMEKAYGREAVAIFCTLNAFKYLWRKDHKGQAIADLGKAKWYIDYATNLLKSMPTTEEKFAEVTQKFTNHSPSTVLLGGKPLTDTTRGADAHGDVIAEGAFNSATVGRPFYAAHDKGPLAQLESGTVDVTGLTSEQMAKVTSRQDVLRGMSLGFVTETPKGPGPTVTFTAEQLADPNFDVRGVVMEKLASNFEATVNAAYEDAILSVVSATVGDLESSMQEAFESSEMPPGPDKRLWDDGNNQARLMQSIVRDLGMIANRLADVSKRISTFTEGQGAEQLASILQESGAGDDANG